MASPHPDDVLDRLATELNDGTVRLVPFAAAHIEPLRAACAQDNQIWEIYPVNMLGDDFDQQMAAFHQTDNWVRFAVFAGDELVGMTAYINPDTANGAVEIGATYIQPSVRGSGFNDAMKKLMIEHAFANGFQRIEFRVDTRNKRSQAAVLKLGAKAEGVLRRNRKTWTGYVRDTAIFGLLKHEWTPQV